LKARKDKTFLLEKQKHCHYSSVS